MAEVVLGPSWDPLNRALVCARMGWRVIPIVAKTKVPAIKNWPIVATTDENVIDEWFNWSKIGCEVGIVTGPESGIWVFDIDVHWCNGFVSAKKLFASHGVNKVPNTFRVKTPSGGEQWYFRYPESGAKVRNISSKITQHGPLGAGLDVRGWHGQVVAPLAIGRDVINQSSPCETPAWLEEIITREPQKSNVAASVTSAGAATDIVRAMANKLAGESTGRNDTLNTMSFKLGLLGGRDLLDETEARKALHDACVTNGAIDEWRNGEAQFDATFTSGWNAGVAKGSEE
jgi:hypothetical protein